MIATALRLAIAVALVAVVTAGGLYFYSPAKSLDVLNDLFPGDGGVERVAAGVRFGPRRDVGLDVWNKPHGTRVRRPVLIFFYGGGWVKGRRQDYGFVAKAFAARGFIVVIPDYRKVPSVRFPSFIEDGAAAVRWVHQNITRFGGDPDHIILAGHSAGAYIAMMLALDRHYLTTAGVNPAVIRAVVGLAGPYDFYPFTSPRAVAAMGNASDPPQTQPISFARKDAPPLWLATGTADQEVRPHNALALAARQRALGSRTTVLREYPSLSHNDLIMAISKPFRGEATVLDDSIAFIEAQPGMPASRDRSP